LIFDDPKNPDVRIRWRRLRSFLTRRYVHPEPIGDNRCPNTIGPGRYITQGPPSTIFQWAEPLFVALYSLGFSYREILSDKVLPLGDQREVYQSVRRQIKKRWSEELKTLHKDNRKNYSCVWHYPIERRGMVWEVSIRPIQGEIDPRTEQWLDKLVDEHKKYLEIEKREIPIPQTAHETERLIYSFSL
jgi:hypothetical protein